MKYYLIAGEASGDLHASNLMKGILSLDAEATFRFWGGDKMQDVAQTAPIKHFKDLAFMGFIEVAANIKTIFANINFCKKDLLANKPDVLILIDYPGFNLRIAEFAHQNKIKTAYYISPQIWAWKESRIKIIRRSIDLMMVILPFEESFYAKHKFKAHFVGHPLLDHISMEKSPEKNSETTIALLPGSRKQEVIKMLPIMLEAVQRLQIKNVIIAATSHLPKEIYLEACSNLTVEIEFDNMHEILKRSSAALVTSGTATLETALLGIPQIVCYKTSNISYQIARRLVKVKYISLVNLIMDEPVVTELIQNEMTAIKIAEALNDILPGGKNYKRIISKYEILPSKLGGKAASNRAASLVFNLAKIIV
jgi:lipid-A-disaccharide synthase